MSSRVLKFTPAQIAIHVCGWFPLLITLYQVLTGNLTATEIVTPQMLTVNALMPEPFVDEPEGVGLPR